MWFSSTPFLSEDMLKKKKIDTTGNHCDFMIFQELCVGTSKLRLEQNHISENNQMQDHWVVVHILGFLSMGSYNR